MEHSPRGRKREHSKCFRTGDCRVGSTPTICAKSSTLRGAAYYFCGKLCKGCKVGFEQPVPRALRPAGQKRPSGAFLGRGLANPFGRTQKPHCNVFLQ